VKKDGRVRVRGEQSRVVQQRVAFSTARTGAAGSEVPLIRAHDVPRCDDLEIFSCSPVP